MWNFASNFLAGNVGMNNLLKPSQAIPEYSDDEASSIASREEVLECPICWESFNIVENVPYVLWCGHTLCMNCILAIQWDVVKFPTLPVQLPLFISCPWCNLLSFRLVYRGNLKFPRKNYFLLWMVESKNGDRDKPHTKFSEDHESCCPSDSNLVIGNQGTHWNTRRGLCSHRTETSRTNIDQNQADDYHSRGRIHLSLKKSLVFFVHLIAKVPLVVIFVLIVLYAIPATAVILILYILITLLFALPSFLILYFSYPGLDWLVREIVT